MSVVIPLAKVGGNSGRGEMLPRGPKRAFILVTALFFLWGMSNNLTDILVQQFRKSFELSATQAQLVQTAVFLGYFFMAVPAGLLMKRKGYKGGIIAGLLLFGAGTLAFWPAAVIGRYAPFLVALFLVGCGSAVLETAANPFIASAGDSSTAERRLNFSQAFNPPGTICGVLLGTYCIFSGVELTADQVAFMKAHGTYAAYLHTEIMRVVPVYVGFSAMLFLWAYLIWRTPFSTDTQIADEATPAKDAQPSRLGPHLWSATLAQFFYVGAQVSTWSALIPYLKQYSSLPERSAAQFLTGCLVAFASGRVVSTALMRWVRPLRLVFLYACFSMTLVAFAIVRPGLSGAVALAMSSFFMAPMYPTIFAAGVEGLGSSTKLGGSVLVMSVVGGALIPPVLGYLARERASYAAGYSVTAACYLIVALYAAFASRWSHEAT